MVSTHEFSLSRSVAVVIDHTPASGTVSRGLLHQGVAISRGSGCRPHVSFNHGGLKRQRLLPGCCNVAEVSGRGLPGFVIFGGDGVLGESEVISDGVLGEAADF